MNTGNRYSNDWDEYSHLWETQFHPQYEHLGDEWNADLGDEWDDYITDDLAAGRLPWKRDDLYFTLYAERWLKADRTVLEVGPGGGKWTVRIAPRVKRLIALDTSEEMLKRTRARCEALGLENIEYLSGNGKDFQPVLDESIDFFFSYDVFAHIAPEDTWPYAQEMARVLAPGGIGVCHHALNSTPQGWDRIERHNDWYRFGRHTVGQYYYTSPLALQRMYERCGLYMLEQHQESAHCTCVFGKPKQSVVPRLERLLKQLIDEQADDEQTSAAIVAELQALPRELERLLAEILASARQEKNHYQRVSYAAKIRRLWRGI